MNKTEHLLTCLSEECAEVAQRVSKALRFGLNEVQPGQDLTNAQRIDAELLDLRAVVEMLREEGALDNFVETRTGPKKEKVRAFMAYAEECGTVST